MFEIKMKFYAKILCNLSCFSNTFEGCSLLNIISIVVFTSVSYLLIFLNSLLHCLVEYL